MRKQKSFPKLLASLLVLCSLSGCGIYPTIGPVTEQRIVFVKYKGIAARVVENASVQVEVSDDAGKVTQKKMDVGGFYLISPDMKDDGKPVMNKGESK